MRAISSRQACRVSPWAEAGDVLIIRTAPPATCAEDSRSSPRSRSRTTATLRLTDQRPLPRPRNRLLAAGHINSPSFKSVSKKIVGRGSTHTDAAVPKRDSYITSVGWEIQYWLRTGSGSPGVAGVPDPVISSRSFHCLLGSPRQPQGQLQLARGITRRHQTHDAVGARQHQARIVQDIEEVRVEPQHHAFGDRNRLED